FRMELDANVRTFIDGSVVVVFIDVFCVREGPGVKILTDLADVLAVGTEFKNLRRGCAVRGSGGVAAVEHENVSFRVYRHTRGFAEMQIRWELEEVGNRVERDFRNRLLSEN